MYLASGQFHQFGSRFVQGVLSVFSNLKLGCWWGHRVWWWSSSGSAWATCSNSQSLMNWRSHTAAENLCGVALRHFCTVQMLAVMNVRDATQAPLPNTSTLAGIAFIIVRGLYLLNLNMHCLLKNPIHGVRNSYSAMVHPCLTLLLISNLDILDLKASLLLFNVLMHLA